ncbi:DUF6802 family protein [Nocardia farcinica]|uniref:DUF6802 family protein n=1 Tax=Nocardia farcinica TaxID=37329 RepID=UPI000A37AC98|nr:DUF6802 family protein [Nocardia farcinica]MBA4857693.1 hypothetical protein [Nocardia farcinica]MBC9817431.1 hypothetical protein [Nocardia farcinica]
MVTSGEFGGLELPGIDTSSSLGGLGPVELEHPIQDIDGDGLLDTATTRGEDAMQVWTDFDHDGIADHVTVVENDGDYSAWEFHRHPDGTSEWVRTDQGKLGE